jgi:hypothetical protein
MSDYTTYDTSSPSLEVRVYRNGEVIARELCESEDEATLAVERYADEHEVSFEVEDLSNDRWPGEILGSRSVGFDDGYGSEEPSILEQEGGR